MAAQDERIDRILFSSSSGGTQAGLLVGVKGVGLNVRVEGIYNRKVTGLLPTVQELAAATAAKLDLDLNLTSQDFILHERYGAPGYGVITQAEREAMRLLARTEGILVDPVYTGRALAGLIDLIRQGALSSDETILFWHTGGTAGLFGRAVESLI
jgi:D-cysteine desulfhydrase